MQHKINFYRLIDQVGRVFANCPGDLGSIPGRIRPKTFKIVLDTSLLNTQQYKVRIKGKVKQSRERSSTLPYTLVYWKGSLLVALAYSRQLYLQLTCIHIYILFVKCVHNKIWLKQLKCFKILKKGPFVKVTSLQRIMSVTIKFILEEVNMEYCSSKKPGGGKET